MKRLGFVLIMMLAVVALLVAGCGGGDGEEATPTATESPGATATQPPTATETPGATATETPAPTQPSGVLGDLPYLLRRSSVGGDQGQEIRLGKVTQDYFLANSRHDNTVVQDT